MNGMLTSSEATTKPGDLFRLAPILSREQTREVLLAASGVWLCISSLSIWNFTWDDSYIGFRYAQNLAHGLGLVFNAGQKVEGCTDFLWVLLLGGATRLSADPILVSKVLGLLCNLSTLLAVYFLCRLVARENAPVCGMALLLTASNTHFITSSVAGLETPLFTALLCWGLVAYLQAIRAADQKSQARWWAVTSLLFAFFVMTRPDGVLTFFLLWLHAVWNSRKQRRNLMYFTLPFLLVCTSYFLWRWHYYGFFFPNTFYVKRGCTLGLLAKGAAQTGKFLGYQTGGWFLSGLVGLVVVFFPVTETTVLGLAIVSRVVFELWSGGITQGEFRFLIPALPLIWILSEHVLLRGLSTYGARPRTYLLLAGTCGLLMVGQLAAFWQFRVQNVGPVEIGMERAHIGLGKWLRINSPPNATVAVGDIGAIAFWSQRKILDLDGFTDTYISHLPGAYSEKRDSHYVLGQAPEFIVLRTSSCSPGVSEVSFGMDKAVYSDPQFKSLYGQVSCWEFWPRYDLLLYQRGAHGGDRKDNGRAAREITKGGRIGRPAEGDARTGAPHFALPFWLSRNAVRALSCSSVRFWKEGMIDPGTYAAGFLKWPINQATERPRVPSTVKSGPTLVPSPSSRWQIKQPS